MREGEREKEKERDRKGEAKKKKSKEKKMNEKKKLFSTYATQPWSHEAIVAVVIAAISTVLRPAT